VQSKSIQQVDYVWRRLIKNVSVCPKTNSEDASNISGKITIICRQNADNALQHVDK
jgi:hypothetical protein